MSAFRYCEVVISPNREYDQFYQFASSIPTLMVLHVSLVYNACFLWRFWLLLVVTVTVLKKKKVRPTLFYQPPPQSTFYHFHRQNAISKVAIFLFSQPLDMNLSWCLVCGTDITWTYACQNNANDRVVCFVMPHLAAKILRFWDTVSLTKVIRYLFLQRLLWEWLQWSLWLQPLHRNQNV